MSTRLVITLKDKLDFIESLLIPSYNPRYKLDTPEKRDDWMRDEAIATHWDEGISAELIKRFGTVDSLEKAKGELEKVEILLEKADEKERKQGKSKRHLFIIHRSSPCFDSSCYKQSQSTNFNVSFFYPAIFPPLTNFFFLYSFRY